MSSRGNVIWALASVWLAFGSHLLHSWHLSEKDTTRHKYWGLESYSTSPRYKTIDFFGSHPSSNESFDKTIVSSNFGKVGKRLEKLRKLCFVDNIHKLPENLKFSLLNLFRILLFIMLCSFRNVCIFCVQASKC